MACAADVHVAATTRAGAGLGPALSRKLARLGLATVGDLLAHAPRRYEDPVPERRIADVFGDEEVTIAGRVVRSSSRRTARRVSVQKATVEDGSGSIDCIWFNQPWLADRLQPGTEIRLRGSRGGRAGPVRAYDVGAVSAPAARAPG